MKNKLSVTKVLDKAGAKYRLMKDAQYGAGNHLYNEIRSEQLKAVVEVLVEEINKVLDER